MAAEPPRPPDPLAPAAPTAPADDETADANAGAGAYGGDERQGGITDFVRRAVSAGVGAASRSKDDIMRAAASEVRTWLERLNMSDELAKVLAKMVIEVKTEIRFRPTEDGKIVPDATNEVKVKGPKP